MSKDIKEYSIETTWDHSQYWQGAGLVGYDIYTDIATGIGDTEMEAGEDACEQLAQNDWDTSTIDISKLPTLPEGPCGCNENEMDECEHHYFVTIRVAGEEEEDSQRKEDESIYSQMVYQGLKDHV